MSEINPRHPLECSNATRWPLGAEEHSEDGRLSWFAGVCFAPGAITCPAMPSLLLSTGRAP